MSGCGCIPTRHESCTARTVRGVPRTSTPSSTYLGLTFRQRKARTRNGRQFNSFLPAISKNALKKISAEVQSWRLYNRTGQDLIDVARDINPIVRGWMQYYGKFLPVEDVSALSRINAYLMRWICRKYKRLRAKRKAVRCWRGIVERFPRMFAHWIWDALRPERLVNRMTGAV